MWIRVTVERALCVARGRDVILCDRELPQELVLELSVEELMKLRKQIGAV